MAIYPCVHGDHPRVRRDHRKGSGMQLRIAHVTATFPPYCGGTGNVCYHNARELARRGHAVTVFTAAVSEAPPFEQCDGIAVHRLQPLLRVGNAPVLPGLLRKLQGFDVVHLHYPFFGGELTTLATLMQQTPLVITYHQDVFLPGALGIVADLLRHTAGRLTLRSAALLLFTSLDYGHASYSRRLLRGREHIIDELPNGVDVERFQPGHAASELHARHNLATSDRVALLVAGLDRAHHFKGVDVFLTALSRLPDEYVGVIVGDGDLRESYADAARQRGIAGRVIFAGRVPDRELPLYYRLADVTVLPSVTMGEAFGLVLVESLASGTPVIASDLPGVRTVVADNSDGFLVEPGDPSALAEALRCITANEDARIEMGVRGRRKVEQHYTWAQIAARLEGLYLAVLRKSQTAPQPTGGKR